MEIVYKKPSNIADNSPNNFCPGCMHSSAWKIIGEVLDEMDLAEKCVWVAGVGCVANAHRYIKLDQFGIPHGRACAVFTGKYVECCMRSEKGASRMTKFAIEIGATPEEIATRLPRLSGVDIKLTEEDVGIFIEKIAAAKNFRNSYYELSLDEAADIYRELFVK